MARTKKTERIRDKKRYKKESIRRRNRARLAASKRRTENQKLMREYLAGKECQDCGITNILVFEFDHVRGVKTKGVGEMLAHCSSWENILDEIKKCEIVCANCHRCRTFKRSGCYRIV